MDDTAPSTVIGAAGPHATWQRTLLAPALRKPLRRETFRRSTGEPLAPLYLPVALDERFLRDTGFPGQYPYTRGVQPTMYRGRLWTMRQYAGFGTAAASNERYRYLLARGQTGLSVAFDLPTQMGYDPDDPMAGGEVGKVGVSIASVEDMALLLDQIPLAKVSVSMTINSTASTLLAYVMAVADRQGCPHAALSGTVQNDILKEYMARGTWIYPPRPSMRIVTDMFRFCAEHLPKWNTISISGYHVREAGCDAAQEIAFTLGDGIAYVDAALKAGLQIDDFAGRLAFFFNGHNNFLEEVAKFRAARRMWARIMRERFGAQKDESCKLRFHTQTGGSTLTAQQPDNNIVRVTIQALAAVLGGTQSLHTNSRDEALGLPTEAAAQVALRTQQVIAFESGVADVVDPLAGSYVVEAWTDELEAKAWQYLKRVDELGGMVAAIEKGYPQREIQDSAWRAQQAVESGEQVIVGVNQFQQQNEPPVPVLRVDPAVERDQVERVRAVRAKRDGEAHRVAIQALRDAAMGGANLMPPILQAVRCLATTGEISHALRGVFGKHEEVLVV
ncbi:MAG: methylmalonyl-CoA mutase [Myxococcales bacterium]|nr:methylmalonyl-CoA mutase [Myxococcales bacterium]